MLRNMVCTTRMSLLRPPVTYVFGGSLIINSVIAIIGNSIALLILWMAGKIERSHKLLTSLAVSDLLVGMILSPITSWQVLNCTSLSSCTADVVRTYFSVLLVGSSVMTLGVIAYDRYILLTKLKNYNIYMTKKKFVILLLIAWLYPASIPILRVFKEYPELYLVVSLSILVLPLIFLVFSYYYISKAVHTKQTMVRSSQLQHCTIVNTRNLSKPSSNTVDIFKDKINLRKGKSHINFGRAVAVLIISYVCCISPLSTWLILNIFNSEYKFIEEESFQIMYLCAMLLSQINSCCNPIIYFYKIPKFRKGFKKLFRWL